MSESVTSRISTKKKPSSAFRSENNILPSITNTNSRKLLKIFTYMHDGKIFGRPPREHEQDCLSGWFLVRY